MGMLLTRKDFKFKNELLYSLTDEQQFDYFTLVQNNASDGAKDDEITEQEYIFSRLIYGFNYCEKFNTSENYKTFLSMNPPQQYIAELIGIKPELYDAVSELIKIDYQNIDETYQILINVGQLVDLETYKKFVDSGATSFQATELFIKYNTLHSIKGLATWIGSKPISRHIEKAMTEVKTARHRLIVQLYVETRGEKKYSAIVKSVAKEQKCENLLQGFVLEK